MLDYGFVNLFYNIIYNDNTVYERDLKMEYQDFVDFKNWLHSYHIAIPILDKMNETMFMYFKQAKTTKQMEHLLHLDFTSAFNDVRKQYVDKTHVIFIPGIHKSWPDFTLRNKDVVFIQLKDRLIPQDILTCDPCEQLTSLALYMDECPGAYIFTRDKERFFPMRKFEDIEKLNALLESDQLFDYDPGPYSYYLHLSDLHLGSAHKFQALEALYESLNKLYPHLKSHHQLKFLISGDLMNTPSEKNMYQANDFMNVLKKHYRAKVSFVLGNHDMITIGLSMANRGKGKAIAYLLGEKIQVFEDDKLIVLKIDSNMSGNFARGAIGSRQLAEIEYELSAIDHLEEYTIVAMLHHHVYPVVKSDFLKRKWNEHFIIGKLMDLSKALTDAKNFTMWLKDMHIRYVVHGHKHVPFFMQRNGTYIISAGSATGSLKESVSKYLSYNVLKYNYETQTFTNCCIIYRDKKYAQRLKIETYLFDEENENEIS